MSACGEAGTTDLAGVTPTSPQTTPPTRGNVDGILRIGVLLPSAGAQATLADPVRKAVEMALGDIGDAGGVLDGTVQATYLPHGPDLASAALAIDRLLADGVDAVIGPMSSGLTLGVVNRLVAADALACSPGATAIELSSVTTDGLFFRTTPSDVLQARALAEVIGDTGASEVAVFYPDDDYGRNFQQALTDELAAGGEVTVTPAPYEAGVPVTDAVEAALATRPGAVAVIGVADSGAQVLGALAAEGYTPDVRRIFVTDGMRSSTLHQLVPGGPAGVQGIVGTSVSPRPMGNVNWSSRWAAESGGLMDSYAAYAFDCATVIGLAARAAGSDSAHSMAVPLASLTRGGRACLTFADCEALLDEGLNIDYDGASGPLDLDDRGDPTRATYDLFGFDQNGTEILLQQVGVSAD